MTTILLPKTDLKTLFIPVIFANGEDDDVPGLIAAFENKPVLYNDKTYHIDEDIEIIGKTLVMSIGIAIVHEGSSPSPDAPSDWKIVVHPKDAKRSIHIARCCFISKS